MSSSSFNCYKILELDKETATINDIKKAYRRLALKYHPDKQPADATEEEKKKANEAFQRMGKAYAVLSDPKRKERYDRTGSMDESEFEGEKDWTAYFKELWDGVVSAETIEAQAQKYRGSEEEKKDVLEAYKRYKGSMDDILQVIECSVAEDGMRFEKMIREAIEQNQVPTFKKFEKTTTAKAHEKRIKDESKQRADFDKQAAEDMDSLARAIQKRNKDRQNKMESIISSIEVKEKAKSGKKRGHDQVDPGMPTDEEFARIQEQMMKRSKKNKQ
ncbi:hypothetical protein G6F70_004932 [Rhizopus microsporus]|uniref:J domain-containing protein n=2 Tax=Rhizopus TaxID=4842 RepID=A0A367J4U1_RHIAZ|nr:hypothetical protein G6F71_007234 [Rhizopus microsporus]RCH84731.1 hypothetical protein CU097_008353 [Rhizopus azygosporus]KAG1199416.1 hypothetical protein G6F70_004932 [Rhizopus microsporus]KAG1208265.1 hypothetical protein G6F69_007372 [Rhizopus microsporus]KAG1229919.1 hypothetical protein G6F67_006824 [Rhizopus microsporus]